MTNALRLFYEVDKDIAADCFSKASSQMAYHRPDLIAEVIDSSVVFLKILASIEDKRLFEDLEQVEIKHLPEMVTHYFKFANFELIVVGSNKTIFSLAFSENKYSDFFMIFLGDEDPTAAKAISCAKNPKIGEMASVIIQIALQ
jgi:hypothetical protein